MFSFYVIIAEDSMGSKQKMSKFYYFLKGCPLEKSGQEMRISSLCDDSYKSIHKISIFKFYFTKRQNCKPRILN